MKEFYIGYLAKMPSGIARWVRPAAILILVCSVVLAAIFALAQRPFAEAFFEFGNVREFSGTILAKPIPFLIVESERRANGLPGLERIALVGAGKHGADAEVGKFDGRRVKLRGTLIYRGDTRMIEIESGSLATVPGDPFAEDRDADLGEMTLAGEIIDSKCFLGVMNPGNRKTHRSCAVACIRGGIPPMFLVKDVDGNTSELWLLSMEGEPVNDRILDFVAEPVEWSGRVERRGDKLFFLADPTVIRRLP